MKRIVSFLVGALAVVGALALVAAGIFFSRGAGARDAPPAAETRIARALRHAAIPSAERRRANPVPSTPDVLAEARAHFADHCASCHGNDGRGQTEMGRLMNPRVPDMTAAATQSLSDGELFFIIRNGVRLTGMPGWGASTPADDRSTWALVRFVRRLPHLTPDEIRQMKEANPVSPAELEEQKEAEEFLAGENEPAGRTERPGAAGPRKRPALERKRPRK